MRIAAYCILAPEHAMGKMYNVSFNNYVLICDICVIIYLNWD